MIEQEFEGGRFPDMRLAQRLTKIAVKTAQDPRASFPQIARSDSELEAIYRFLSNSRVRMDAILEPHERLARHGGAIAGDEPLAVQRHSPAGHLHEGVSPGGEPVLHRLPAPEARRRGA